MSAATEALASLADLIEGGTELSLAATLVFGEDPARRLAEALRLVPAPAEIEAVAALIEPQAFETLDARLEKRRQLFVELIDGELVDAKPDDPKVEASARRLAEGEHASFAPSRESALARARAILELRSGELRSTVPYDSGARLPYVWTVWGWGLETCDLIAITTTREARERYMVCARMNPDYRTARHEKAYLDHIYGDGVLAVATKARLRKAKMFGGDQT